MTCLSVTSMTVGRTLRTPAAALTTLAGYVARNTSWALFERSVEPVFKEFGVELLHARDLHNTDRDFKGWSRSRKEEFVSSVYELAMIPHVPLGLTISVEKKNYEAQRKESRARGDQRRTPYTYCLNVLCNRLLSDKNSWSSAVIRQVREAIHSEGLSFVIESGHENNAEAKRSFEDTKRQNPLEGVLRAMSFETKRDSRAIQVADLFAYYSRRHVRAKRHEFVDGEGRCEVKPDPIFRIILRSLHHRDFWVTRVSD